MLESKECIEVIKPGMLTTIQDLGRAGFQQYGMIVSGAMDSYALRIGNMLLGNDEGAAGLEITMVGPKLLFLKDMCIAITGGDLSPMLDGEPVQMWGVLYAEKGSILEFGKLIVGARAYLTIRGGIDVPLVMNSRSTYLRAGIGGFQGRALKTGDRIQVNVLQYNESSSQVPKHTRRLHPLLIPTYQVPIEVGVILGPQADAFTSESIADFLDHRFIITPQSDRMGYRLQGVKLKHKASTDMISEGIVMGSIQVPASGDPIIVLADRQTTGGYPKIATVITVDLPLVAQAKPGDPIDFTQVTVTEAQERYIEQEKSLKILRTMTQL